MSGSVGQTYIFLEWQCIYCGRGVKFIWLTSWLDEVLINSNWNPKFYKILTELKFKKKYFNNIRQIDLKWRRLNDKWPKQFAILNKQISTSGLNLIILVLYQNLTLKCTFMNDICLICVLIYPICYITPSNLPCYVSLYNYSLLFKKSNCDLEESNLNTEKFDIGSNARLSKLRIV